MEGLRNVHHTVLRRTRSPSHPCGSLMAGVRGWPRGVAPITPHPAMRDTPVVAYGRRNGSLAPSFLVMRGPDGGPLFASSRWLLPTGRSM